MNRPIVVTIVCAMAAMELVHVLHRLEGHTAALGGARTWESNQARFVLRGDDLRVEARDGTDVVDLVLVRQDDDGVRQAAGDLAFAPLRDEDGLEITFPPDDGGSTRGGVRFPLETPLFVPGRGELSDLASEWSSIVVLEGTPRPVGIVAKQLTTDVEPGPKHALVRVTSADKLTLFVGQGASLWKTLFEHAGIPTLPVRGHVTGASGPSRVVGVDDDGHPTVRVVTDANGHFELAAPATVTSFYAIGTSPTAATRMSAPVAFAPGSPWELSLDVSDGGELHVTTVDADTGGPVTVRLLVHGVRGSLDPSFGPDYRASGAGPLLDALGGTATTPLPAGHYRVAATKGIEWSIDAQEVDIASGKRSTVALALRHVVPTPNEIGCDLHVHARPSFDAPVTPEDRVLSLVAAGIDFAVPSEHNIVGNYGPALSVLGLSDELTFAPGVEVTTYTPKFGHFGAFPYPATASPPPFKNTTAEKLFGTVHADPARVVIVNHPRLSQEIGYFLASGWKAGGPLPLAMRKDFDGVEVFNGYESGSLERVDAVMHDFYTLLDTGRRYIATGSSDSHRIQYQWAGYPRTMVRTASRDPAEVVAALKGGHATVTDGPVIDLVLENTRPGGEIVVTGHKTLLGRLVVRAAPWVDVTSASVVLGGKTVQSFAIPSRPLGVGPEPGSLEEAQERTIRLDAEVRVDMGGEPSTWVLATARGTRTLDDILPFMPVQPFAATNPIFVHAP